MSETRQSRYESALVRWVLDMRIALDATERTLIVGLIGPQGVGKSTLAHDLTKHMAAVDVRSVAMSVDDFYLTRAEQRALAQQYPHNRYLQERGYPGTHDTALGVDVLDRLAGLPPGQRMALPRYDKSACQGRGDRAPEADWPRIEGRVDIVILEGWLVGFAAVHPADPELATVDAMLEAYLPWWRRLDALVQLRACDVRHVVKWRLQAEQAARRIGRSALSDADTIAYVRNFLPAYALWPSALAARPPTPGRHLDIEVGEDRLPAREFGWSIAPPERGVADREAAAARSHSSATGNAVPRRALHRS